jgi:hypothetical protein
VLTAAAVLLRLQVTLLAQGIDPTDPSMISDERILTSAFELIVDIAVQAGGLTAFRIYRWADARRYGGGR